jgi:hypothetical protein
VSARRFLRDLRPFACFYGLILAAAVALYVVGLLAGCAPLVPHRDLRPLSAASLPACGDSSSCWGIERCDGAERAYGAWGGVAAGAAAVAGGGALTTAFPDSQGARIGLGVGSAVVAVVSAVAVFERDRFARQIVAHCAP